MRRLIYIIPRYREKTGGKTYQWIKLYHKDLLISQAWKKLRLSEKGAWIHLLMTANRQGELRSGHLIYTDETIAKEIKCDLATWKRVSRRLMSPKVGLLARIPQKFRRNSAGNLKPNSITTPSAGSKKPNSPSTPNHRLDKKRLDKTRRDGLSQKLFFKKGTRIKALSNRYLQIKSGQIGIALGQVIHFKSGAIHQEQVRENPYDWEVMDAESTKE